MITPVKLAYYREKDWERFLESIDDRERMHNTWDDWHKAFVKIKMELISQGFYVKDCIIDIDELTVYCKNRGIRNNGKARSQFTVTR